jgi:hypothetical protein
MIDIGLVLSVISIFLSSFVVVKYHFNSECVGGVSYDGDCKTEKEETKHQKLF